MIPSYLLGTRTALRLVTFVIARTRSRGVQKDPKRCFLGGEGTSMSGRLVSESKVFFASEPLTAGGGFRSRVDDRGCRGW